MTGRRQHINAWGNDAKNVPVNPDKFEMINFCSLVLSTLYAQVQFAVYSFLTCCQIFKQVREHSDIGVIRLLRVEIL